MIVQDLFKNNMLYQNDDWDFSVFLPDYDCATWTLQYAFAKKDMEPFTIQSQAGTGSYFRFVVAAANTNKTPGLYVVTCSILDQTGKKTTLGQSQVTIRADLSLAENGDPRSPNRIAFDDVETALASGAGSDVQEYTVGGTVVKKNRAGLLALRAFYLGQVRQEAGVPAIGVIKYYL
jgi:hypothetical protein